MVASSNVMNEEKKLIKYFEFVQWKIISPRTCHSFSFGWCSCSRHVTCAFWSKHWKQERRVVVMSSTNFYVSIFVFELILFIWSICFKSCHRPRGNRERKSNGSFWAVKWSIYGYIFRRLKTAHQKILMLF